MFTIYSLRVNMPDGNIIYIILYVDYSRLIIELILHCDTATEGCVLNDFFRHSLDDSPASYLT